MRHRLDGHHMSPLGFAYTAAGGGRVVFTRGSGSPRHRRARARACSCIACRRVFRGFDAATRAPEASSPSPPSPRWIRIPARTLASGTAETGMYSESLVGTVKTHDAHLFLVDGDASAWPSKEFEREGDGAFAVNEALRSAAGAYKSAVHQFAPGASALGGVKLNLSEAGGGRTRTTPPGTSSCSRRCAASDSARTSPPPPRPRAPSSRRSSCGERTARPPPTITIGRERREDPRGPPSRRPRFAARTSSCARTARGTRGAASSAPTSSRPSARPSRRTRTRPSPRASRSRVLARWRPQVRRKRLGLRPARRLARRGDRTRTRTLLRWWCPRRGALAGVRHPGGHPRDRRPRRAARGARAQALARVHRARTRRQDEDAAAAKLAAPSGAVAPPPAASPCDACDRSLSRGRRRRRRGRRRRRSRWGISRTSSRGTRRAKAPRRTRRTAGDAAAKEGGERDARDRDPAEAKKPEWVATLESMFTATAAAGAAGLAWALFAARDGGS